MILLQLRIHLCTSLDVMTPKSKYTYTLDCIGAAIGHVTGPFDVYHVLICFC